MPKKPKKRVKKERAAASGPEPEDELDKMSTASQCGSLSSEQSADPLAEVAAEAEEELDESTAQEVFEEQLREAIDGILEKSMKTRTKSLMLVTKALQKKLLFEFLTTRYVTLADAIDKSIKRGKGDEQKLAAKLVGIMGIQLGLSDEGEAVFSILEPVLMAKLNDPGVSLPARAMCAEALGICGFIATDDMERVKNIMSKLEAIFTKSYHKGDKTAPSHTQHTYDFHFAALQSWSLLLSISTQNAIKANVTKHLAKLPEILDSSDVDLRIAAGETIALVYELAREYDEDFEGPQVHSLCQKLKQLSTDNSKHQARKNRKVQRSSFRDILAFIETGDDLNLEVKFQTESIYIDSWARKRHYDTLCQVLASGINVHLQENSLVRQIFLLGDPIVGGAPITKVSRNDRRLFHQTVGKNRSQLRQKQRDKRSANLSLA